MISLPEGLLLPPIKMLALLSPLIVSEPAVPVIFSKLVAPAVVSVSSEVLGEELKAWI